MIERRGNPWTFLAIGAMAAVAIAVAWAAVTGANSSHHAIRHAAEAVPDIRPQLPEAPKLPNPPLPIPK